MDILRPASTWNPPPSTQQDWPILLCIAAVGFCVSFQSLTFVRLLAINERRFIISDGLGMSHCIVLVTKYSSTSLPGNRQWQNTENLISNALKFCIKEHPGLKITIVDPDGKRPLLAMVDNIDLSQHVVHVRNQLKGENDQQKIRSFLEYLHGVRLPRAGEHPQWCVYVSEIEPAVGERSSSFFLAFMHSHCLWDGLGTITLHDTFLRALNGTAEGASTLGHKAKQPPPPIETAGRLTISWSFLIPIVIRELLPAWLASALGCPKEDLTDVWTGPKTPRPPLTLQVPKDPPTAFEVSLMPDATVQRAVQVCRMHGARLTALLNFLAARAVCRSLGARGQLFHKIRAANAIDLRKALGKGHGELANYVSFVSEDITVPEDVGEGDDDRLSDEVWNAIRQNTINLANASNRLADQPVALLKYISDLKGWLESQAVQPANVSFGLSNLGVFDGVVPTKNDGGEMTQTCWRGESAVVSQSGNKTGAPLNFQLLSTKSDSMGITATWWPGMLGVSDESIFVKEVMDRLCTGLERFK
ncbi:hypothetical protein M406DRAFT_51078 [Cryphonectria parasitica EP155]|uniref:Uncharacterized protein n=1 Tax=Cryphonectria parasitica (strain ATCC 38755 / EP155) TaxID=660469 RepID=A0A9P4XZ15_CRYP1|nr:uncharacterized protein M406DRAFT_51078 [Cryphonectria parasitica EP155]KAF3763944.1 hypothetical protein M406DRAFT_51078 [Cryphonectria parasitica EP155]